MVISIALGNQLLTSIRKLSLIALVFSPGTTPDMETGTSEATALTDLLVLVSTKR